MADVKMAPSPLLTQDWDLGLGEGTLPLASLNSSEPVLVTPLHLESLAHAVMERLLSMFRY